MYKSLLAPYIAGGALAGASWYIWYHLVWTANSNKSLAADHFFGYGIYGMALATFFFHPRHYWAGFLLGGAVGKIKIYLFIINK